MLSAPAPGLIGALIPSATSRGVRLLSGRFWFWARLAFELSEGGAELPFWCPCDQLGQLISRMTGGKPVTHVAFLWQPGQVQKANLRRDIL
jgi:hypothetical protein